MMEGCGAKAPNSYTPGMRVSSIKFTIGAVGKGDLPAAGLPEIAFAGRSNVGKSSLINRLVQRKKLARTSSTPGKTQQLNYYLANEQFYLVDLPGYGFVSGGVGLRSTLGKIVGRYISDRQELRAVLQLIDARHGPTELDLQMIEWLQEAQKPFLLVFTKADKLSRDKLKTQFDRLDSQKSLAGISFVSFSAVDGRGKDDIWGWIDDALVGEAV
jgi:GTP-binding protein